MKMCGQALAMSQATMVGCWQRKLPYSKFQHSLLLSSLEWVTVYISRRFEELQASVIMMLLTDNQRNVSQPLSCVGENLDLDHSKGWLALQKSAQKCPYLSTRIPKRNVIPEEVQETMFRWPCVS